MATLLGPWDVKYPVNYYEGGDTVTGAFGKHIQEIVRIYGLLNALDAGKLSIVDFNAAMQEHVNSANPHPNLSLETLKGNLPFSRITGNVPASRIDGLDALIDGKIPSTPGTPDSGGTGDGITESSLNGNGYVKFNNGLILQWGTATAQGVSGNWSEGCGHATFPISFPSACFCVSGSTYIGDGETNGKNYTGYRHAFYVNTWDTSGFGYCTYTEGTGDYKISYIAIGR